MFLTPAKGGLMQNPQATLPLRDLVGLTCEICESSWNSRLSIMQVAFRQMQVRKTTHRSHAGADTGHEQVAAATNMIHFTTLYAAHEWPGAFEGQSRYMVPRIPLCDLAEPAAGMCVKTVS
eukprot:249956-Pelagomonas_calceolata.AAC.4